MRGWHKRARTVLESTGMSLLEVIIAMGIASVMFVGVTQMSTMALRSSRNVAQVTEWSEIRNNIRSTVRSYQGCTRTLRLLHNPLNITSPGNIPAPGTTDVGQQLGTLTSIPGPGGSSVTIASPNRIAPLRMSAPPNTPLNDRFCDNPAFSAFTLTGQDRVAQVGQIVNGLQVTCIYAQVINVGTNTSWSAPEPAVPAGWPQPAWPQDIPGGPMTGTVGTDARQVTYSLTITARKIQTNPNQQEMGTTTYSETIPVMAWVDARNGKVLGCSGDLATACNQLGGDFRQGGNPECVFNHMVLETRPTAGTRYTAARTTLQRTNGGTLQGIYARGGMVIPIGIEASTGTTTVTRTDSDVNAGGITFDNGKTGAGASQNMAAIRISAPAPTGAGGGELVILGQPNNTAAGAPGSESNAARRLRLRGSNSIALDGPLTLTDPRTPARSVAITYPGGTNQPAALLIDTNPTTSGTPTLDGTFMVQTSALDLMGESTRMISTSTLSTVAPSLVLQAARDTSTASLNDSVDLTLQTASPPLLNARVTNQRSATTDNTVQMTLRTFDEVSPNNDPSGLYIRATGSPSPGNRTVLRITHGATSGDISFTNSSPIETPTIGGGTRFVFTPGTADARIAQYTGAGGGTLLSLGTLTTANPGFIRMGGVQNPPTWRVLAMGRTTRLIQSRNGNASARDPVGWKHVVFSPTDTGCPRANYHVQATVIARDPRGLSTPVVSTDAGTYPLRIGGGDPSWPDARGNIEGGAGFTPPPDYPTFVPQANFGPNGVDSHPGVDINIQLQSTRGDFLVQVHGTLGRDFRAAPAYVDYVVYCVR